jgi:hypothetical protein
MSWAEEGEKAYIGSVPCADNPVITSSIEETQNTGFRNIFYITFHESDATWWERDYYWQIQALSAINICSALSMSRINIISYSIITNLLYREIMNYTN